MRAESASIHVVINAVHRYFEFYTLITMLGRVEMQDLQYGTRLVQCLLSVVPSVGRDEMAFKSISMSE